MAKSAPKNKGGEAKVRTFAPSHVRRALKKAGRVPTHSVKTDELRFDIVVTATGIPTEIAGYIVAHDDHSVTLRHKAKSGSSRMVISTFPMSDVQFMAMNGEKFGYICVKRDVQVVQLKSVRVKHGVGRITAISDGGDTTVFNTVNNGLVVSIVANDNAAKPADKKSKAALTVVKGSGKKGKLD